MVEIQPLISTTQLRELEDFCSPNPTSTKQPSGVWLKCFASLLRLAARGFPGRNAEKVMRGLQGGGELDK